MKVADISFSFKRGIPDDPTGIGCTGGQHRSVCFAELLAKRLAIIDGIEVEIVHSAKPYWKIETGGNEQ